MNKCSHNADPGLCGYRGCRNYGRGVPPNRYVKRTDVIGRPSPLRKQAGATDHPNFVSMADQTRGGWKVLSRGKNAEGKATFNCVHVACGSDTVFTITGKALRVGPPKYCESCRPAGIGGRRLKCADVPKKDEAAA